MYKLKEKDRKKTLEFLYEEPEINLFIIGDIENYGFENDIQDLWASFDQDNNIEVILLRYRTNFIPYFKNLTIDVAPIVSKIMSFKGEKVISGKKEITDLFLDKLKVEKHSVQYFCALKSLINAKEKISENIKVGVKSDCKKVADFLNEIPEFVETLESTLITKLEYKSGRIYFIENENKEIISTALTSAESSNAAMVVGVATNSENRKKGLASQCVTFLCQNLLSEGKSLCLFYHNPKAGRIYKRLGFKDIDKWTMLFL